MFRSDSSDGMLQAIATIAILAVTFWSIGLPLLRIADAANLTSVTDTIGDSTPSATTNHTIQFTIPAGSAGVEAGETIEVTFPSQLTGTSSVTLTDLDLEIDSVDETLAGAPASGVWTFSWSGNTLVLDNTDSTVSAGEVVTIKIGSSATAGGAGADRLINPGSEGSYEVSITSGEGVNNDNGATRFAVINGVTVSASVDTIFNFSVSGTPVGTAMGGGSSLVQSTTTTIPFGLLKAGFATTSAQQLEVSTNAKNGYTVTVQVDSDLQSSTGATIDSFADGSDTDTPAAWAAPSGTLGTATTYGHWGVTSDDTDAGRVSEFSGGDNYVGVSSTTPHIVMGHTGPANGQGVGVGTTTVGYKIEISALQEAGDDYSAVLTYIATPVF